MNTVAIITGSSQGIGQAIAARLAQDGVNIAIDYHTHAEGAEETLRQVEAAFPLFVFCGKKKGGLKISAPNLGMGLALFGITVNSVAVGANETAIKKPLQNNPADLISLFNNPPLKPRGQPADVAEIVAFL